MNDLVRHLTTGDHPVVVGGPQPTLEELMRRVTEIGYACIKFTDTKGGTDLGVRLDRDATDLSQADFDAGTGIVHLEGSLTLDYVPVRCIADLDLATLAGTGRMVLASEERGKSETAQPA
jgi:hypothetical protein